MNMNRICSLLIGSILLMLIGIVLFIVAEDAKAADFTIGWTAHPEGDAVNIRVQTGPTDTGPWATLTPDAPGTSTQRALPYVVAPGATGCVRARAIRIADGLDSAWTTPVCMTVPAAPVMLKGLYLKLP